MAGPNNSPNQENKKDYHNLTGFIQKMMCEKSQRSKSKSKLYVNLKDFHKDLFLCSMKEKTKYGLIRDLSWTR